MKRCRRVELGAIAAFVGVALVACEGAAPEPAAEPPQHLPAALDTTLREDVPAAIAAADSLGSALDRLVRGESGDSTTWFSEQTAKVVRRFELHAESGAAIVDFHDLRELIPNASSSAGSEMLLRELNAAVFSVGGVDWVHYAMEGDCELFGEWLQYGECLDFWREGASAQDVQRPR